MSIYTKSKVGRQQTNVSIDLNIKKRAQDFCIQDARSFTSLVESALVEYMDRYKPEHRARDFTQNNSQQIENVNG